MARKQWSKQTSVTPALLLLREKRKWQIALRRYVVEQQLSPQYAPYFGLDIAKIREWFSIQFSGGMGWDNFGKTWQFSPVIPLSYFSFADDNDLRLCWHFSNLRAESTGPEGLPYPAIHLARQYFQDLYSKTGYTAFLRLLSKIDSIEQAQPPDTSAPTKFVLANKNYLDSVVAYSRFEFELLNSGRSPEEILKEIAFLKKF